MTHNNQMNNNNENSDEMMTQEEIMNLLRLVESMEAECDVIANDSAANEPNSQKLKMVLTGSSEAVDTVMRNLQFNNYAAVDDWSPSRPNPDNPDEVVSMLIRHTTVE